MPIWASGFFSTRAGTRKAEKKTVRWHMGPHKSAGLLWGEEEQGNEVILWRKPELNEVDFVTTKAVGESIKKGLRSAGSLTLLYHSVKGKSWKEGSCATLSFCHFRMHISLTDVLTVCIIVA